MRTWAQILHSSIVREKQTNKLISPANESAQERWNTSINCMHFHILNVCISLLFPMSPAIPFLPQPLHGVCAVQAQTQFKLSHLFHIFFLRNAFCLIYSLICNISTNFREDKHVDNG
jgi:hypothetical protein